MESLLRNPATSLKVYGVYVFAFLGLPFLLVPGLILPLVGIPAPTEVWIRVLAMTILFLGFYYYEVGQNQVTIFYKWSVYVRLLVPVFFISFVLLGWAPPVLIAFCIPDVLFALWTRYAIGTPVMQPKLSKGM